MVLVGGSDEIPAKCFHTLTGEMWAHFPDPARSCMTIDVSKDNKHMILGDATGNYFLHDLRYECYSR